jgi:hypothetical protein
MLYKSHQTRHEITLEQIIELGSDLATFDQKGYIIEGDKVIHPVTNELIPIQDILGEIRNVRNARKEIIAKRKNLNDSLRIVRKKKVKPSPSQ